MSRSKLMIAAGLMVITLPLMSACGSTNPSTGDTPTATSAPVATTAPVIKVGLVTDIGGLDDKSFNHLADVGLNKAHSDLGVQVDVAESKSETDYIPNLTKFAQGNYNLVIAVGFLMANAVDQVALQFPATHFAIIDNDDTENVDATGKAMVDQNGAALPGTTIQHVPNLAGLLFKEQQAGYLVGYMAGLLEKDHKLPGMKGKNTIAVMGGLEIPPVTRYIAGYYYGARAADPGIKISLQYSQSFTDQTKANAIGSQQISKDGADILFQVDGGAGAGYLKAAKDAGVYGIGVDADQGYLNDHVITSALKKVDVAVYSIIQDEQNGNFKGGIHTYDMSIDGVGFATPASLVPADVVAATTTQAGQLTSGAIVVSPDVPK